MMQNPSSYVRGDGGLMPSRIHADRGAGTVTIEWGDGHLSTFDTLTLRWLCPCAYCRGEAGQPGWLDTSPTLTDDQTRLVGVALVGQYAIEPTWGDGHQRGFYTFRALRDECPCVGCEAARTTPQATPGPDGTSGD
jgi:DUF971 family protein